MNRRGFLKTTLAGTTAFILGNKLPEVLTLKEPPKGFRTGLEALDTYTGGFEKGNYITIFGERASGKTILAHQICLTNGKDGHRVLKISESGFQYHTENWYDNKICDLPSICEIFEWSKNYDLVVIDAPIVVDKLPGYGSLQIRISHFVKTNNKTIVSTMPTYGPIDRSSRYVYTNNPDIIPTILYPDKMYKIKKYPSLDQCYHNISVIKNRYGPANNLSFLYKNTYIIENKLVSNKLQPMGEI